MKIGDGLEDGVALGPLINQDAITKVQEHIADATAKGGTVFYGGWFFMYNRATMPIWMKR